MFLYVVNQGDNLYSLSRKYNVPLSTLIEDNGISDPDKLAVGQSLIIRSKSFAYIIKRGDTLYGISRRFGIPIEQILRKNEQLTKEGIIYPGQSVVISYENDKKVTMEINGYAYPTMSTELLRKTLPHLTYISIFSYRINNDGTLVDIDDERIINEARQHHAAPIMSLTNIKEAGGFDSSLAHSVLSNDEISNNLIDNMVRKAKQKNYYGINIDFEYVYPDDKENYNKFIEKVSNWLEKENLFLTTALAPKEGGNKKGLLYEAHDYPVHGKKADRVVIMTYEWGYTFGPAMPVAPINRVEDVLKYAITVIPSKKILMGIPNYGYDFNVPFVKGVAADSISNTEAVDLAIRQGVEIKYDIIGQTPYFEYKENNQLHQVYFEDARSISAKILLALDYNLGGLNYWTLKDYFPQNWVLVDYYLRVSKVI